MMQFFYLVDEIEDLGEDKPTLPGADGGLIEGTSLYRKNLTC